MGMGLLITQHKNIVRRHGGQRGGMTRACMEQNGRAQLFSRPQHPYTQQRWPPRTVNHCRCLPRQRAPRRRRRCSGGKSAGALPHPPRPVAPHGGLCYALKSLSFELRRGSVGLVGIGSGKSTTGLALLRLLASQGAIWFDGEPLHPLTMKQMLPYRSQMQIVFRRSPTPP